MSGIVTRLRESATQARALDRSELLNEAADEIVKIRREAEDLRGELTDAEREAVAWFAETGKPLARLITSNNRAQYVATLRSLLERLK